MSTRESVTVDFTVLLLDTLGYTDSEFVSIGHDADGEFSTAVMPPTEAPAYVDGLPGTANVYFGVNPTKGPARRRAGRGTETAVTRLAALFADLDVGKPGACPSFDVARAIIANLSIIIGSRPTVIVHSGHGLHPYWPVEDGHIRDGDITPARALLKRWGRLVDIEAGRLGVTTVDTVFDLARMLRVPGTTNNKAMPDE